MILKLCLLLKMDYRCMNLLKSIKVGCAHNKKVSNQLYATCTKKLQNTKQFSCTEEVHTLLEVCQFEFRQKFCIQPYMQKQISTLFLLVKYEVSLLGEMDFL